MNKQLRKEELDDFQKFINNLPKKSETRNKRSAEQLFCTKLQRYLKHNCTWSGPIEVKVSYTKSFNYKSGFKPHQIPNLINATKGCVTYKISDVGSMSGFGQNPWDIDVYYKSKAYVAIQWVGEKIFYLIKPEVIKAEIDSGSKSLIQKRAAEIATLIGELK